jgi:outer membrane protein assembly factor BamB
MTPSVKLPTARPSLTHLSSFPCVDENLIKSSSKPIVKQSSAPTVEPSLDQWSSNGGDITSSRSVTSSLISSSSFSLSIPTHNFSVGSSVFATPAIFGDYVIFPALDGYIYAYNKSSSLLIWKKYISSDYYANRLPVNTTSRTTPARFQNSFLIGTRIPGDILKIDIANGALLGSVRVNSHPDARITSSGTVFNENFYVGVSSAEEATAEIPGYQCCTFAGTFHSIHIPTMTILWTWRSIPLEQSGYRKLSGAAIWGSSPSIDSEHGIVYFSTGNNYMIPADLLACYQSMNLPADEEVCNENLYPENWFDSVVALNISNGEKVWSRRFSSNDSWNHACYFTAPNPKADNCQYYDSGVEFGMCPTLSSFGGNGKALYIGHKTGITYCLNPLNGSTIWATQSCPGGKAGGHVWGFSVDETRVYTQSSNHDYANWTLLNGSITNGGGWSALDKVTGTLLWTTSNPAAYDPSGGPFNLSSNGRAFSSWAEGPPATVGDIVLVTSADAVFTPNLMIRRPQYGSGGYVYALSKSTGEILSSYETKASVFGGFSVDSRCAFVGSGYWKNQYSKGKGVFGWCV